MTAPLDANTLGHVAARTLEDACFIFSFPLEQAVAADGELVQVQLRYGGPVPGVLRLTGTADFGAEVAGNLLGLSEDEEEARQNATSALGELLNIIAGTLMAEAFGTRVVCPLGVPEYPTRPLPPAGGPVAHLIASDRHPVQLELVPA